MIQINPLLAAKKKEKIKDYHKEDLFQVDGGFAYSFDEQTGRPSSGRDGQSGDLLS